MLSLRRHAKTLNFFKITIKPFVEALPPTVESRCEVKRLHAQLCGAHYDAEYGLANIQVCFVDTSDVDPH